MTDTLRVIDSFFIAETGDTFKFSKETGRYSLEKNEDFYKIANDHNSEVQSSYYSKFEISSTYAESLIKEGFLEEVIENNNNKPFVNVFDEINALISKYSSELDNNNDENLPLCMKVEKETVLKNLIKVLNYLKDLKK